jgi:tRNA pseudouridine(38-40) synthase
VLQGALDSAGVLPHRPGIDFTKQHRWSRTARTDKGVHALVNAVSFTCRPKDAFYTPEGSLDKDSVAAAIRRGLPEDITLLQVFIVAKTFDVRLNTNSRTYKYMLPRDMLKTELPPEEVLAKVNSMCKMFLGTHKFHNYSKELDPKDPSTKRHVLRF